jgi:hypothetical protein
MTFVRTDVWSLGNEQDPWHPTLLAYAKAVRAMQSLPIGNPRSWRYQAAIHGVAGVAPPAGAPWNACQHASWYFLPWHRMYLYRFEQIVRSFLTAATDPTDWALPYWNYSSGAPGNALPPAFRERLLPSGADNPLFVPARRDGVNKGDALPASVVDTSVALAEPVFTGSAFGGSTGFGGPRTGFAHQGPAFGVLEAQPHGPVHVHVGGATGLMRNPNTAALDPIFWLHHANIDRLWELWRGTGHTDTTDTTWRGFRFTLRDATGAAVTMRPRDVLDTVAQLDYTYDSPPAVAAVPEEVPVTERPQPVLIGAAETPVEVTRRGATTHLAVEPLPGNLTADVEATPPQTYLNLADIEGEVNPGIVYGVYLNLPDQLRTDTSDAERAEHLAGVASFFGIELTTAPGAAESGEEAHAMRYSFNVTNLVNRLQSRGEWDPARVTVTLHPVDGSDEPATAAAGVEPPIRIGTVSVYQG